MSSLFDTLKFALASACVFVGNGAQAESETVRLQSPYPFSETVARLKTTITGTGMTIFADIDQRAAARAVGMEMTPTTVLIYGNPAVGTTLMQAAPEFALELPLRVLILDDARGHTWVVFTPSTSFKGRHGLPAGMEERLSGAEKMLAAAVHASR